VQTGAVVGCRFRVDELLHDRAKQPAHELAAVGGAEHLDHLEQGRLIQGHRVSSFCGFLGEFSQSLTAAPCSGRLS